MKTFSHRPAPAPVLLAEVVAAAIARWHCRRWAELVWVPAAAMIPPVLACGAQLEDEIVWRLRLAEASYRRRREQGRIALRCWAGDRTIRLELTADCGYRYVWRFSRRPELGRGAVRQPRRRVILPASPQFSIGASCILPSLIVVSPDPAMIELAQTLAIRLRCGGVWSTASLGDARHWLAHHPDTPLVVVEADDNGPVLWLSSPSAPAGPPPACLKLPALTSEIYAAARRICRCNPGKPA